MTVKTEKNIKSKKRFIAIESRVRVDFELTPRIWWLRSADSEYSYCVGYVYYGGSVSSYNADNCSGVLPVCTIWSWDGRSSYRMNLESELISSSRLAISGFVPPMTTSPVTSVTSIVTALSITTTPTAISACCPPVRSENRPADSPKRFGERFLNFWYNRIMNRQIFKKSDKSKSKPYLTTESSIWWLRSTCSRHNKQAGFVNCNVYISNYNANGNFGVSLICII